MDPEGNTLQGLWRLGPELVEIGPITFKPQEGDMVAHRKALAVGDRAPVDRYVVPSQGAVKTYCQLKKWRSGFYNKYEVLLVHVAPNDDSDDPADDIRRGMHWLVDVADFFVVSFPSSILHLPRDRRLEAMNRFCINIERYTGAKEVKLKRPWFDRKGCSMPRPLLLKLSPDLSTQQLHDIASVALSHDVSGVVICGNVRAGAALAGDGKTDEAADGGVGVKEVSTRMVRVMYALIKGKLPIIASGGVATAEDAHEKGRAGASLVQVGQALLVDPGLGSGFKLREGLVDLAYADCYKRVEHAIGADHRDNNKANKERQKP